MNTLDTPQTGRTPPHSIAAEENLISACLLDGGETVARCVTAQVEPGFFYRPAHGLLWETIREMHRQSLPISVETLAEELKSSGQLEAIGGLPFLLQVSELVPTTAQAGYFVEKVRELYLRREIIAAAHAAVETCHNGDTPALSLLAGFDALRENAAFAAGLLGGRLDAARLRSDLEPPPLREVFRLNRVPIATPGNVIAICAQAKAGKTAFVGAMLAAAMGEGQAGDFLGVASGNPERRALVHLDSEQAPRDHWLVIQTAMRRAGLKVAPPWLMSYGLAGWPIAERRLALEYVCKLAKREFGGVHSLFLDGVADFVNDPNDGEECFPFVDSLQGLAVKFDCPVIAVLHLNPGSAEKSRGHLGSQLERRAETNLLLEKDGETGRTVVYSTKQRRAPILKADAPCFRWDDTAQMHVAVETIRMERDAEERAELSERARDAFANSASGRMRYGELSEALQKTAKWSERTANRNISRMRKLSVIREVPPRLLELVV
jgi:hypothetical protein